MKYSLLLALGLLITINTLHAEDPQVIHTVTENNVTPSLANKYASQSAEEKSFCLQPISSSDLLLYWSVFLVECAAMVLMVKYHEKNIQ